MLLPELVVLACAAMPPVGETLVHLLILVLSTVALSAGADVESGSYLVVCGRSGGATVGRQTFVGDASLPAKVMDAPQSVEVNASLGSVVPGSDEPSLYQSARVFTAPGSYAFAVKKPGRHFVRLHFFPSLYQSYDLAAAAFKVSMQGVILVNNGYAPTNGTAVVREFSVNVVGVTTLTITFTPTSTGKLAFVNAIEVVPYPDELVPDTAEMVGRSSRYAGLSTQALETVHRVNMGSPAITPSNDTLRRTWLPDQSFQVDATLAVHREASASKLSYTPDFTRTAAPDAVYATATELKTTVSDTTMNAQFNMTWRFNAPRSDYLLRLHFCDIVSKAGTGTAFNVYVGGWLVLPDFEISQLTSNRLAVPVYKDFILTAKDVATGDVITVTIGSSTAGNALPDGFLNGLEIMRVAGNTGAGFDGTASVPEGSSKVGIIAGSAAGGVAVLLALGFVGLRMVRRRRKPEKKPSNTTNWSPFTAGSRSRSRSRSRSFSNIVVLGQNSPGAGNGGYRIPLAMLQEATGEFDEGMVIGEGGFGKVYKGTMRDGTAVAAKRGNRRTQQGIHEFHTEIEMLSRLRHRHLVSLIGYCDERGEMILVYEYMAMGTLRSHLYGNDDDVAPLLSWKQRLEACIGAARGLHYLHTGSAKAIIHRDVKSANILLDGSFMAKVADFGLSKTGPELDQTHVSTKVKGSFGYLDPEYFRRQMLTEKSDVYSFGVVLLEVLCARAVIDPSLPRERVNLAEWATQCMKKGELERIVDQRIAATMRPESLKKFADTAEKCLAEYGVERPTMGDVLWCLEYALQLQVSAPTDGDGMETPLQQRTRQSQVQRSQSIASVATETAVTVDMGDLDGLSMSGVFSKMINSEEVR